MSFKIIPDKPNFLVSLRDFLLYATLRRSLRSRPVFLRGGDEVIVLITPHGIVPDTCLPAVKDLVFATGRRGGSRGDIGYGVVKPDVFENARSRDGVMEKLVEKRRLILLAEDEEHVLPDIRLAADAVLPIVQVTPRDLQAAFHVILKQRVSVADAEEALNYPLDRLCTAARPGRSIGQVIDRLKALPAGSMHGPLRLASETPPLGEMHGYGVAKAWGLQLASDLKAWRDGKVSWDEIDRGMVLHGLPGVGKTLFAKSLAAECKIPLIATSLGQWQAAGHLGDCLKRMRRSFAEAKDEELALLFIDELDSLGDRSSFAADHRDYSTQVVNCLLECLDGVEGREGVIVIGATNQIDRVDPAILRSGRLDRAVEIPLPSADDRVAILEQGLSMKLGADDRAAIAMQTAGLSGADLAKAVRDAKRIARRDLRPVAAADLIGSLPALIPLAEDYRRRNALHEAGHTLVGLVLGRGEFVHTYVSAHVRKGADVYMGGQASFAFHSFEWRDKNWYLDRIALMLGGIAAEKLVLGEICDGAGGDANSDLARATEAATMLEVHFGMGGTLRWSNATTPPELEELRRHDVGLRRRIDRILAEQLDRAIGILGERQEVLDAFTRHLVEHGMLTASAAHEILGNGQLVAEARHQRPRDLKSASS